MFKSEFLDPKSARVVPWLVAVAFFMQMLDSTILNVALPGMAEDLEVAPLRMQSVVISYMVTCAFFIPVSGWLSDRFGSRKVFFLSINLFTLGSLFCALSYTLELLVFSRIIQGIGGALMMPVGRLVVLKAYPRSDLVRILSFVTIPALLGPLMGPAVGGLLVQYASWHWIFLINIPVGIVGAFLCLKHMPALKDSEVGKFDLLGFIIFGLSMVLISFALEGFGELHMPKVEATILCVSGLLFMALYWLRSIRIREPIFSSRLFCNRSFAIGIFGNFFARLGSGAMPFVIPLFLQLSLGFSPLVAGLTMTPAALAGIIGKQLITPLVTRMGFRAFLVLNTFVLGVLMSCFYFFDADSSYIMLLTLFGIFGVVNSMQFTAMNSVTLIDLPQHDAASGNSLLSVVMQISASCGVAIGAALLDGFNKFYEVLPEAEKLIHSFHSSFLGIGIISIFSALIFALVPADAGKAGMAQSASST